MKEKVRVGTVVYNMNTYDENINLYVAMYKDNILQNVSVKDVDIPALEVLESESDLLDVPDGCTRIKAFVWNGDSLCPVRLLN